MMRTIPLIAFLLAASPAFGQSPLYTNADLGRHVSPVAVSPETLRSLAARQFRLPPAAPDGPTIVVVDTTPTFARTTDELIDNPARYVADAYFFNVWSLNQSLASVYGYPYGMRPRQYHRSWGSPAIGAPPAPPRDVPRARTPPARRPQ